MPNALHFNASPRELPPTGYVVGCDVGWSKTKRTSSVCVLNWSETQVDFFFPKDPQNRMNFRFRLRDETDAGVIANATKSGQETPKPIVAIDGPLGASLENPPRVFRLAERMLSRGDFLKFGMPGAANSPIGVKLADQASLAAIKIQAAHEFETNPENHLTNGPIVEAFPNAFLACLLDEQQREQARLRFDGEDRSDIYFELLTERHASNSLSKLLVRLLPGRDHASDALSLITDHEQRASLVCAVTALCAASGWYSFVGRLDEGVIILPPAETELGGDGMTRWAQDQLAENDRALQDTVIPRRRATRSVLSVPPDNGLPIWYELARHCVELLHAIEHDSEASEETLSGVLQSLENCGLSPRALFGISGDIRNAEAIQTALGGRVPVEAVNFERGSEFHYLTYTLFWALHCHPSWVDAHPVLAAPRPRARRIGEIYLPSRIMMQQHAKAAYEAALIAVARMLECLQHELRA